MTSSIVMNRRNPVSPVISFLVPAFNEKNTILTVLDVLSKFPENHEIIVIDDGSIDGTRELLREQNRPNTIILFHEKNAGKGAAIQTGLGQARGRYVAIQDADLEYDPMEYVAMLRVAQTEKIRVIFGSRFLQKNPAIYLRYLWGNKLMTFWINCLTGGGFTDTYTCYKLIDRDLFSSLAVSSRGFEMEAEICVKLACVEGPIREVPIHYRPRRIEEGKKINARDAIKGFMTALKVRWAYRR